MIRTIEQNSCIKRSSLATPLFCMAGMLSVCDEGPQGA